ncbi:MAG: hypothetical protein ABIX01_19260 [Chitinophagaceae bacterium]
MLGDAIGKVLEKIISEILLEGKSNHLTATRNFLCSGFATGTKVEKNFDHQSRIKEEQAEQLRIYGRRYGLFLTDFPDENLYLTKGGEAKSILARMVKRSLN